MYCLIPHLYKQLIYIKFKQEKKNLENNNKVQFKTYLNISNCILLQFHDNIKHKSNDKFSKLLFSLLN